MQKPALSLLLAALLGFSPAPLAAWGELGHRMAAAAAFKDLPPELVPWFAQNEATLEDHASDPDQWKLHEPAERPRHYLNSEAYGGPEQVPLDEDAARAQLGEEQFLRDGSLPWTILARVETLSRAFRAGDPAQVAFEASILSHYVGDMCVPLHTARNHNGAETGQHGVHGRWETGLLERIVDQQAWQPETQPVQPLADPLRAPWAWLKDSHDLVAGLLKDDWTASHASLTGLSPVADGELAEADEGLAGPTVPSGDGELQRRPRGGDRDRQDPAYWSTFLALQEGHVKGQLTLAGQRTAQLILQAWLQADRPEAPTQPSR